MRTLLLSSAVILAGLMACAETKPTTQKHLNPEMDTKNMTAKPTVRLTTSMGDITLELFQDKAPLSVANFLEYVKNGHYDGTIFHRVIQNFMIQGGGFTEAMSQKATKSPIKNEADNGLKNTRGTIAMARTMVVDSATSQFFINVVDNVFLDFKSENPQEYGYAVFGKVTEGMDVVDKIRNVATGNHGGHQNVPTEPIVITKAEIITAE